MSQGIGLIRRGFHEIPHLMVGGCFFIFCGVWGAFSIKRHLKYDRPRCIWKRRYTVVREEDFNPNKQVYKPDHKIPAFW